jgi:hypothetical protein
LENHRTVLSPFGFRLALFVGCPLTRAAISSRALRFASIRTWE